MRRGSLAGGRPAADPGGGCPREGGAGQPENREQGQVPLPPWNRRQSEDCEQDKVEVLGVQGRQLVDSILEELHKLAGH